MFIVPAYLPPISFFKEIVNLKSVYLCKLTNYQKQTYRNRCFIYSANGMQKLTIPVKHNYESKSYVKSEIYNELNWQKTHWKAIESAYSSSPFFEHYTDIFFPFYDNKFKLLFDFNYEMLLKILECIQIEIEIESVDKISSFSELNKLLDSKKKREKYRKYSQVFDSKNGFITDLSIIDLIFNLGPETNKYLNSI